ncbi:unnamed protein product [Rhizophagus irregularis]|nr:unnamed protein product [Rhizophagus irregularis]
MQSKVWKSFSVSPKKNLAILRLDMPNEYQINLTKSAAKENPELLQNNVKRIISITVRLLKDQCITKLETKNVEIAELRKKNVELRKENTDFKMKFANFEAERAELKCRITETLRITEKKRIRCDAENVKFKVTIKKLRKIILKKTLSLEKES